MQKLSLTKTSKGGNDFPSFRLRIFSKSIREVLWRGFTGSGEDVSPSPPHNKTGTEFAALITKTWQANTSPSVQRDLKPGIMFFFATNTCIFWFIQQISDRSRRHLGQRLRTIPCHMTTYDSGTVEHVTTLNFRLSKAGKRRFEKSISHIYFVSIPIYKMFSCIFN